MGRVRKRYFLDRLLELPQAAELIAKDHASYHSRCIVDELRNGHKPKSEREPVPLLRVETFEKLALIEALFNDIDTKERQSMKGSIPKREFTLEMVYSLVDIWADRMLRDGFKPDHRGWKKHVFMNLNLSAWSVVAARLKEFGVTEDDLVRRMQALQCHV